MTPIVDSIGQVVAKMRDPLTPDGPPYYEFGTWVAITNMLIAKDNRKQLKYKKYPLIFLILDTPETDNGTMVQYDLNIGIAVLTKEVYTPRQRYEHSFRSQLYPLYEQFLKQLRAAGMFTWPGRQDRPPHTKIDRPYWGAQSSTGNTAHKTSDPWDAIEIQNLRINERIKVC